MKKNLNLYATSFVQQTYWNLRRIALATVFGLMLTSANAGASQLKISTMVKENSIAYVQVSSAKLRSQPQINASVLAKPVTNTPIKVIAKNGDWCEVDMVLSGGEISNTPTISSAAMQHGYIACNLLSSTVVTLSMVDAQIKSKPDAKNLLDLYARAFWIAPSLTRFTQVGTAMQNAYLDQATRSKEIQGNRPLRYKVPEFEAMKQRIADGITVSLDATKPEIVEAGLPVNDPSVTYGGYVQPAQKRIKMPAIKPSFFKKNNLPVIMPSAKFGSDDFRTLELIDSLSASNKVQFRAVVTSPASYALHPDVPVLAEDESWQFINSSTPFDVIVGVWDVGSMHVSYDPGAVLHGVTESGEPTAQIVTDIDMNYGSDIGCGLNPIAMESLPKAGYAPSSSAIISWAGKPIPRGASARAKVKSRRFEGKDEYDLVISYEIDLDRDGIFDFMLWQGRYQPQVSAEGLWEAVFVNVDGKWRLFDYNEDADCT